MIAKRECDERPRVSVITIFFDAEEHFSEAIDSVLAQEFDDFELILVDDGSSDSSTAMAKDYAGRDSRVRYFEHAGHANRGMSASRNLGLAKARADLVAFIDADDRWKPSKLGEQVELLERMPGVDVLGGAVNYWASHAGGKDSVVPTGHVQDRPIKPGEATLALYPLGKAHAPSMSDLMIRKECILAVGGFEEAFRGAYEDQAFLAKLYLRSTLYFTNRAWSDYRLHSGSCMAKVNRTGTYHDARRAFLEWFERYLQVSARRNDVGIRDALERALRPYRRKTARLSEAARAIPFAVPLVRAARAAVQRLRPLVAPGPAILMYHRIADEGFDPWGLAVSPENFADQLDWIKRNRTALPLAEFIELNRHGRLPRDAIALTFDDGYACNGKTAGPLLEREQIAATIFVSPDLIARGREFWWDELERIVLGHGGDRLRLDGRDVLLGEPQPDDSDWPPATPPRTPRQQAYQEIWSLLYGRPSADLQRAMTGLRRQARTPDSPRSSHRPLTPEEVRATGSALVSFGSHSLTHASLPKLAPEERAHEIEFSVSRCESLTGVRPSLFAYPYGDFEPRLEKLVEQAGFVGACKADGWFVTRKTSPFALPRIFVGNWDSARLARQLGRP